MLFLFPETMTRGLPRTPFRLEKLRCCTVIARDFFWEPAPSRRGCYSVMIQTPLLMLRNERETEGLQVSPAALGFLS